MKMRLRSRFTALAALLALLGSPALSCVVPQHVFSTGANECCRQMGAQCGSKKSPSPYSCCKSGGQDGQPYVNSADHSRVVPAVAIVAILLEPANSTFFSANSAVQFEQFPSPHKYKPEKISVLRI